VTLICSGKRNPFIGSEIWIRDNTIEYEDYFWNASDGSINTALFNELFNEH